jgi:hypothetical protein
VSGRSREATGRALDEPRDPLEVPEEPVLGSAVRGVDRIEEELRGPDRVNGPDVPLDFVQVAGEDAAPVAWWRRPLSRADEIVRIGARQMLATALQAEVIAYVEAFADEVDEHGRRLVVRNGYHAEREVVPAAGAVPVR